MTTQVPPDAMNTHAENELICEKLLGWERCQHPECDGWWHAGMTCNYAPGAVQENRRTRDIPSFTTWAGAGLILEAMGRNHHIDFGKNSHGEGRWFCAFEDTSNIPVGEDYAETGPLAIRAAALEYIRSLP